MEDKRKEVLLVLIGLGFCFIYFCFILINMEWVSGGADSYSHFLISKYAYVEQNLLFHHWGKPFFTLVSSPFAQIGLKGVELFNVLCLFVGAWLSYQIGIVLKVKFAWLIPFFVIFAPLAYSNVFSSLTEPFGLLIIALGLYLLIKENFVWAMVAFSFLIFVRNEAFILFPLLIVYNFRKEKILVSAFLLFGFLSYSLLGAWTYSNLFWIIEEFPYKGAANIYGSGDIIHFLNNYQSITHLPIGIAFVLGVVFWCISLFQNKEGRTGFKGLLIGMSLVFVLGHSIVWNYGLGGSYGLTRVLLPIIPLIGIVAVWGWSKLIERIGNSRLSITLSIVLLTVVVYIPIERQRFPKELDSEERGIKMLSLGLNKNFEGINVAFYHPAVAYYLNLNPFGKTCFDVVRMGNSVLDNLSSGDLLIWDSHFGPNEGKTPINLLEDFRIIDKVEEGSFQIYLFRKK